MNDEAAFLAAISAPPADELPRMVYADWLDDHDDPRGAYLRAECQWAKPWLRGKRPAKSRKLRQMAANLDPVWVARVSRPPLGVCIQAPMLVRSNPPATAEAVDALAAEFGVIFPPEYRAFLLDHNGLSTDLPNSRDLDFEWLFFVPEVSDRVRKRLATAHERNRRCGVFPIGCHMAGANSCLILLGVGRANDVPNKLFGRVFRSHAGDEPWLDAHGAFIGSGDWDEQKAANSLAEFFVYCDEMVRGVVELNAQRDADAD